MAEYSSLREESLAAIEHRMTATNFTFAALAVIIAGLLSSDLDALVAAAVLVVVVPQLAKSGLLIWLGEYERSQRAGRHIAVIERRVNRMLGDDTLTWESGLKAGGSHMGYPYRAVLALLLGTGYASVVLGAALVVGDSGHDLVGWLAAGLVLVVAAGWEWWFFRYFMRKWGAARDPGAKPPGPALG
jgi:hypothetical protein